jgi:hypothetical protein
MLRRYFTALLFTLLLVITQQGLVAHEISHIDNPISHSQKQDKSHANFCEKCANYSELGSGLTPNFHQYSIVTGHHAFHIFSAKCSNTRLKLNYSAQAPPSLS